MDRKYHRKIMNKTRTAGDGMESDANTSESMEWPFPDISSTDKVVNVRQIFPSNIIRSEKKKAINMKTPKFVPYEPYTGAVKPMTPTAVQIGSKKSKNNMDINILISQMSQMDTKLSEFKPRPKLNSTSDKISKDSNNSSPEKIQMQKQINDLSQENESFKEQLKQQVQVDSHQN